jgi:GDP-L-fucose synthase
MNLKKKIYETNVTSRCSHLNIGSGIEINIKTLSQSIKEVVGFKGKIKFDKKKTNGVKRKFLNTQIIRKLGWKPKMPLKKGLLLTYKDFLKHC